MRRDVRLRLPRLALDAADRRRRRQRAHRERRLARRARRRLPRARPRPRHRPARRADLHVGDRGGQLPARRDRGLAGRGPPRGRHRRPAARADRRRRQPGDPAAGDLRRLPALVVHPARPRRRASPAAWCSPPSTRRCTARSAPRPGRCTSTACSANRSSPSARSRGPTISRCAGGRAPRRSRRTRAPRRPPDAGSLERIAATVAAARRGLVVIGGLPGASATARPPRPSRSGSAGPSRPTSARACASARGPPTASPASTRSCSARGCAPSFTPGRRAPPRRPADLQAPRPGAGGAAGRRGDRGAGAPLPRRPRAPRRDPGAVRHRPLLRGCSPGGSTRAPTATAGAWGARLRELSDARPPRASTPSSRRPPSARSRRRASCRGRSPPATACSSPTACRSATWRCSPTPAGPRPAVAANRGASGIDGVVSTAAGFACGLGRPATLMIGDLSLLHDLTALLHLRALPQPLVIVALNNGGGGHLPLPADRPAARPARPVVHGAARRRFRRESSACSASPATARRLPPSSPPSTGRPARSGAPAIIEVRTDRAENLAAHRALGEAIVAAVDAP